MVKSTLINKSIFDWVLVAKGIGIVLVVVGHFYPDESPEYWCEIRKIIYTFHMPLFFLLSGYLFDQTKYSYVELIKVKINRLIFPFLSIAVIFFLIKYVTGMFFLLKFPVKNNSVLLLFIDPVNSYMPLLWFLYTLFLIFLFYSPIKKIVRNDYIILILFIFINIFIGTNYPVVDKVLINIPFFILGIILRSYIKIKGNIISGNYFHAVLFLLLFFLIYIVSVVTTFGDQIDRSLKIILGAIGSLCIINISCMITSKFNKLSVKTKLLKKIGLHSMTIYLFHTLFVSAVYWGCRTLLEDFKLRFEMFALLSIVSGIIFPIFLEKMILQKNQFSKRFILGLNSTSS